jgi:6,7-dimethyl-8-ribityllumazine synthase
MPKSVQGEFHLAKPAKFAIAAGRFNTTVVEDLVAGALDVLGRHGVDLDTVTIARVPGAWELPLIAKRLCRTHDAVIALGCIIRGDTPHFDYVAAECSKGLAGVGMDADKPVIFGVLTTDTVEQATARAGGKAGNKGADAAMTAIEMLSLLSKV